ncbi:hypothetical protein GUITHDRAFT_154195, partial [Guillardia theta CCMP2712]
MPSRAISVFALLLFTVLSAHGLTVGNDNPPKACYKAPVTAVSDPNVVIYDRDAPCGPGRAYIHNSGNSVPGAPMTAGAGPEEHTYVAAEFSKEVSDSLTHYIGQCMVVPQGGRTVATWRVNRNGCH